MKNVKKSILWRDIDRKTRKIYSIAYIIGVIITIFILGYYQRNYINLHFNHEVVIGEITDIRFAPLVRNNQSDRIYYRFSYNGNEIEKLFTSVWFRARSVPYRVGDPIIILHNSYTNTSYPRQEMVDKLIIYIFLTVIIPVVPLGIIQFCREVKQQGGIRWK